MGREVERGWRMGILYEMRCTVQEESEQDKRLLGGEGVYSNRGGF